MDRLRDQYARSRAVDVDVDIDEIPTEPPIDEIDDLDALDRALAQLPLLVSVAVTMLARAKRQFARLSKRRDELQRLLGRRDR